MAAIDEYFLRDTDHGGDTGQASTTAQRLASFVDQARRTVHLAIYDFRLADALARPVVEAFAAAAQRGVDVRIAYDHGGKPQPQPAGEPHATTVAFAERGGDPAPRGTHEWLHDHFDGTAVQLKPINPGHQLMHDKYLIRDGATPDARVWTGSTNFTDDAWAHQENNIITLASPVLAAGYERDFGELWRSGTIGGTGARDDVTTTIGTARTSCVFAPGQGPAIDNDLASLITAATTRIAVASMVLTSHTILAALADALDRDIPVAGIYDQGQMGPIVKEWQRSATGQDTAALFERITEHLASKTSAPYRPDGLHNFMHHKVLVCDQTVATGSFNLSRNATRNAENSITITSPTTAARYRDAINTLITAYGSPHLITTSDPGREPDTRP